MKKNTLRMKNVILIIFVFTLIGCENKTANHTEA